MLEARTAASRASGRNGRHCRAGWWMNLKKYATAFGEEEALKFERLEEQNVLDIANFVRYHAVDCDFQNVDTVDAYSTDEAWAEVLEVIQFREEVRKRRSDAELLIKRDIWHGKEACEHLGLQNILGAVTYPAHTQNPYLLVCKMLELSLEKGLNLQSNTPVFAVEIEPDSHGGTAKWKVHTDRGTVRAKQVVLATNAYTNALHVGIEKTGFLMHSRSQVSGVRPRSDLSSHPSLKKSVALNDRGSGDYFLIRAPALKGEGDVLFGGGRAISETREMGITDDSTVNVEIASYLKHSPLEVFDRESWGDQTEEIRDWSSITCYTLDTFPLVGEVPGEDGLWALVGMNGHGMTLAFRSAEALVTMMITRKEPEWFPKSFRIKRAWERTRVNLWSNTFVEPLV